MMAPMGEEVACSPPASTDEQRLQQQPTQLLRRPGRLLQRTAVPAERHRAAPPRVYLIFLGPNWKNTPALDAQAKDLANNVFGRLRGSAFNHILTQYYDASGPVANDTVLAGYDEDS